MVIRRRYLEIRASQMAEAFPSKQLWCRTSPCVCNRHSPYLVYIACTGVWLDSGNRIWIKLNILCKQRAINRGGVPVSRHHVFALMPVAQFWEAGISLGMPPSLLWMSCSWCYVRGAHPTYFIYWYVYGCGDELKPIWAVIYLSNGIFNASFVGVVMKKGDCAQATVLFASCWSAYLLNSSILLSMMFVISNNPLQIYIFWNYAIITCLKKQNIILKVTN